MKPPIHLTPHNGLNQGNNCINVYNCYIFLANEGNPNTGVMYMRYSQAPPGDPQGYNFVVSFDPVVNKTVQIDFTVGIPSVVSTFIIKDQNGHELGRVIRNSDPNTDKKQPVSFILKNFTGNRVLLQVVSPVVSADIFYFYDCYIHILE